MHTSSFDILGLTPADAPHPALALALARAGALTILDLEFCRDSARAEDNFRRLLEAGGRLGLRVTPQMGGLADSLLKLAPPRSLTLVLVAQSATSVANYGTRALALYAEICNAGDAETLGWSPQALVAKGHEAGGWVGEDSSYILAQKLLNRTQLPVYLHGGIGLHGASASRVAGAAGIVLDDQLLLLDESPLPEKSKAALARLNGAETRLLGEAMGLPCRVFAAPGGAALKSAEQLSREAEAGTLTPAQWREALQASLGWNEGALLPLGQGIGMAASFSERYRTVARLLEALRGTVHRGPIQAAAVNPLLPGSALAVSHGTHYPLAQGPMTRVSDSPDFAVAVAANGALPFLALALMRGEPLKQMLRDTQACIGDKPWGVGMLGFVPQALREEQCAAIWETPPPFALIAGGRPDQAAEFERRGIRTYIHAPTPALLRLYLEQGARRFVFEGRECGGHIGPLTSFPLWEQMIEVLLRDVKPGSEREIHLLFAGGIHSAQSGAMLAALTAPLVARGMKVGALMGTAYLFTREIVETGAIVQGFQDQALACTRTVSLESGPGHSTRCADTRFAQHFSERRRDMIRAGRSADEIKDSLEDLNLGRLRVASKGLDRNASGAIVTIAPERQLSDGMYMIGQVATLREQVVGIESLHAGLCDGSQNLLDRFAPEKKQAECKPSDIAIVGIGVILPGANDAQDYWRNIVQKIVTIGEVPKSRWDADLYFDEDRKARDKTYSRWGGFIDEIAFDPLRFGIPPKSMKAIDPMQLLTLEVASRALADAGCIDGQFDRGHTSIILGAGGGLGDLGLQYGLRAELPRFAGKVADEVWDRLPEWTEESFAGSLLNVAAGRVANRLDLGGVNFVVDAACASSLAAISLAVNELESGRSNLVLAGGIDTVQSPFGYISFSKTQALSPTGKPRTFDVAADGIAISEGLAVVALKRLVDAERDGDRIYAVIKAAAGSSDGKALGLTAPRPEGQIRAIERTYAKAGFSPATLGLIEAHGTGTPVGDRAEAQTITGALLAERAAPRSVALGSVKTLIGHTKAGAGVAGLIKVALSLHHRVLPAHHGVETPIDAIADPASPVHILREPRPWLKHPDHPRRGGVSAFGFGGTNFHAALEEHAAGAAASGADRWPSELFLLRAVDAAALKASVEKLLPALAPHSSIDFAGLALALARALPVKGSATLAIVAANKAALSADLQLALAHLSGEKRPLPPQIRINLATPLQSPALAFLFPGQGAQYVGMAREAALYTEEMRGALELADRRLRGELPGLLSTLILPTAAWNAETETAQARALTDTRIAQPAIGAVSLGYLRLTQRLGLRAAAAAGHSYGEYGALLSAGVIDDDQYLHLSAVRGKAMGQASARSAPGAMAAVQASREKINAAIGAYEGVLLANHNAPEQSVISGPRAAIEQAAAVLNAQGLRASLLPVSGAFHTALVADARAPLSAAISATEFRSARFPVYSNTSGQPYPSAPAAMQAQLDAHLLNSVEFVAEIEAMHAAGIRVFLELGPKSVCANMVKQTLAARDAVAVSLDGNGGGLRGLLIGLAELSVAGVAFEAAALFRGRDLAAVDLSRLDALATPPALPKHFWMVSGGNARPLHDPEHRSGKLPQLDKAGFDATTAASTAAPPALASPAAALPATIAAPALSSEALIAYQQTMRQFLALQEKVVQQFLGGGAAATLTATAPALLALPPITAASPLPKSTPVATAIVAPTVLATASAIDHRSLLLAIVAERTGYPEDMLGLDADLEADLGIDSIKRVEILGALRKALPADIAGAMQTAMERFTKARSLNAILGLLPAALVRSAQDAPAQDVASSAAAKMPVTDYKTLLLAIVAERTGYPEDMLGLDADLEADLGIDSIKRVEILGALRKALPADIAGAMQTAMERFTKARSLSAILALLLETSDPANSLPAIAGRVGVGAICDQPPSQPSPASGEGVVALDFRSLLLAIVAERTGYPEDMLGADADLEADLGIDSIKRVEILGALRKALPTEIASEMQAKMERYTKARSLNAILALLPGTFPLPLAGEGGPEDRERARAARDVRSADALSPSPSPASGRGEETSTRIPRYLIQSRPAALTTRRLPLEGLVLLLGGPAVVVTTLQGLLAKQGLHTVHVADHETEALKRAIGQAQAIHGPVRAVLHLHGLVPGDADTLTQWRALSARTVLSLFHATQNLGNDLSTCRVIAATRLGGSFGRDATGSGAALAGGVIGLLNCLRQEEPAARMRTVDFDGQTEPRIAQMLVDELLADDDAPEAGYLISERNITVTVERPLSDSVFAPKLQAQAGWVVLVTGGARGITAEIADELAVPGAHLVLLGRTVEPSQEAADTAGLESTALRKALIAAAQARHEKATPAMIDRRLTALLAEREIRNNLQKLRARGAIVEYRACDVRDDVRLGTLIDALYEQHGRIDAVIHGAGVIEDKLLRDKTLASFDRVFGTKLDAMFVLSRKLRPESLRLFAVFTSVAGRYGNRGQSDYAAANEALNRLAWAQSRLWPKARVIAINWGPWDAGMASEAVRTQLRARGMEPIPVAAGRRMFTEELAYGNPHDVELVAGRGPWHAPAEILTAISSAAALNLPLIRATPRMGPGGNMVLDHLFSLDSDPYLAEHRIDGRPALTQPMAREWMTQFVAAAWPGWRVAELRELRQFDDIVLVETSRALQLRARASSHSDIAGQAVSVEILDPARKLPLCRATAILVDGAVQAIAEAS